MVGAAAFSSTLNVTDTLTCSYKLDVANAVDCESTLAVGGDVTFSSGLAVTGATQLATGGGATTCGGDLTIDGSFTATDITCSSDVRLKTDIHTITNGLDIVNSLRAVTWKWKPELNLGENKLAGVVAQEAQSHIAHAVRGTKDHLRVDYNSLTGYLISAVQGLTKQVEDLKAQLQ